MKYDVGGGVGGKGGEGNVGFGGSCVGFGVFIYVLI